MPVTSPILTANGARAAAGRFIGALGAALGVATAEAVDWLRGVPQPPQKFGGTAA